jgi:sortase A
MTPRSPRRLALIGVALLMVVSGLGTLGYAAWEFFGTNIVARHAQRHQIVALRQRWAAGTDQEGEQRGHGLGDASALIRIPRFGDSYVMPVLEGTSADVLAQGFGHVSDSAAPGRVGNYALAAHRVTHGEPLRDMPELRPGDQVVVETRRAVFTYVLDTDPNDLIVPFTAGWVLLPFPVNPDGGVGPVPAEGRKLITLTTCSEIFHTDNRMVTFGHLTSVELKASTAGPPQVASTSTTRFRTARSAP